jgi:hypothetical protein
MAAEFTVTADVPVELSVNVIVFAVFTVSLPKLRLEALIVNCGLAAVPVPLRVTAAVPPVVELLLMVIFPLAAPVVVGSNWTCSVTDWFGFSVTGKLWATIVKPAPVIAVELTVTADVPEEVSVTVIDFAVFTVSLPKLRLDALTVNWGLAAAVPVPLKATLAVPPVIELLLIVSCPVTAPVAVGLNWTCSANVCFGFSVAGKVPPTIVKPVPEIASELTVTADVPEEVSVTVIVFAVFTVSLPKLRLDALSVNWGPPLGPPEPWAIALADGSTKQQIAARTKAVHRAAKPRGRVPGQTRSWFGFGKLPWEVWKGVETIGPGKARIAYFDDTNITSWNVQKEHG